MKKGKVLLLTSYCGGGSPDCSDDLPCLECLQMCNVATVMYSDTEVHGGWDYLSGDLDKTVGVENDSGDKSRGC